MIARIRAIVDDVYDGNITKFSKDIDMPRQSVDKYCKETTAPPALFISNILEKIPNISAEWLVRGKGDMYLDSPMESTLSNIIKRASASNNVSNSTITHSLNYDSGETIKDLLKEKDERINELKEMVLLLKRMNNV